MTDRWWRVRDGSCWLYFERVRDASPAQCARWVLDVSWLAPKRKLEKVADPPADLKLAGERRGIKFYFSVLAG